MGIRKMLTVVSLALSGCTLGSLAADVPQGHPASPSAKEAAYSPQPTPISGDDSAGPATEDYSKDEMQGMDHGAMHHHHAGGK